MRDLERKKEYQKEYYLKNKEVLRSYRKTHYENNRASLLLKQKEWSKNNPDSIKSNHLKFSYNLSLSVYKELYSKQEGCCACCGKHESTLSKKLGVDHCHTTGKIRGLLCNICNLALGYAKDDVRILANMIEYLKNA